MPPRAIKAIFFARFHHEKGSRVLHQVPEGSITPSKSPSALPTPLFDFDAVSTYVIPTQQFCDRLLTFCANHHRIIGYPVCVRENGKYNRNEYIFNFALVIEESVKDWAAYGEVARKMGRLLRGLEEQAGFLSREEQTVWEGAQSKTGNGYAPAKFSSKVYALCEVVLEDLNNYAECMIPIDDSNTINLKLFPVHPPPPPIHSYQVPLLTISLDSLTHPISSDLTLNRIIPYIDGINSVSRIAQLADTDLSLTRKALQHLAYYGCLVLLDVFHFGAIYAPTADIGAFVMDKSVQEECARYVRTPSSKLPRRGLKVDPEISQSRESLSSLASETKSKSNINIPPPKSEFDVTSPGAEEDTEEDRNAVSPVDLIMLYASLRQGLTLREWVLANLPLLHNIDIRRFITFGIIKGFLYRVHKYAISTSATTGTPVPPPPPTSPEGSDITTTTALGPDTESNIRGLAHHHLQKVHRGSLITGMSPSTPTPITGTAGAATTPTPHRPSVSSRLKDDAASINTQRTPRRDDHRSDAGTRNGDDNLPLVKFLDGMHCFDEICTEVGASEKVVEEKIKALGDVGFFWR